MGIGETREDRLEALEAIAASHRRHGHVQEAIVQNFLPKAGTAMHRADPCPPDDYLEAIALARLVLPPEVHVQAPPNLSDDFGRLLDAGIDDWGGVSPVTADHVNPERPWPAVERLREVTEAAGRVLAPRLTVYPEFALAPERWLDEGLRFPVLDHSDAEALGRDDQWYSGAGTAPPVLVPGPSATVGPVAAILDGVRAGHEVGEDEIVTLFSARGPEVAAVGRGGRRAPPAGRGRRGHLRPQPEHQLHERLHLQVSVLRVLQGPALLEPAGEPLPAHPG